MTPELSAAIDGLYAAFRRHAERPAPLYHEGADPAGFGESLRSKPLRLLGPTDLATFKWKALTTWGDADDFRHYLPRMLELETDNTEGHAGEPEPIFSRLDYGGWRSWPPGEQHAIEAFCLAWWIDVTQTHPSPVPPETVLCCLGQITDDLRPYLREWRPHRSLGEALQFAGWVRNAYCTISPNLNKARRLSNAWWTRHSGPAAQAMEWLLSPERAAELESAFFAFAADAEAASILSDATNELYSLRVNAGPLSSPAFEP